MSGTEETTEYQERGKWMETEYYRVYSGAMGRDMEMKRYGHAGRPILFIPCQDGRFYDFENYKMTDVFAPWIESGRCMVFAIDTADLESWSNRSTPPYWRIRRYEDWLRYIVDEAAPMIRAIANEKNGWNGHPGIIPFGCSLGATHAANLFFRWPDVFDGCLALSGIYTATYGFGDYWDEVVYRNSVADYMANLPHDHPYISKYNSKKAVICVGQGPWEIPETTIRLRNICAAKGITGVWVDTWGGDCAHDWDWWYKQVAYFLPHVLS